MRDGVALTNALDAGAPTEPAVQLSVAGVVFREISDDDVEQVVGLWEECGLARPWNDAHRDVADSRTNPTSTILVAHDDAGSVVVTAMAGYEGHRGWIYYVAVAPSPWRRARERRRRRCRGVARGRGARKVRLMVRTTNTPVLGFYERLGYTDAECTVLGRDLA
ncbi:GNAT family acetyltransferase [Oerskovia sp. M15]